MIRGLRVPVHLTSRDALRIFDLADIWAARTGNDVRLVSANDHVHSRHSLHYEGLALDFHSSDPDALSAALERLGYRVLWNVRGHYGHVHVEPGRAGTVALSSLAASKKSLGRPELIRAKAKTGAAGKEFRGARTTWQLYRAAAGTLPMRERK